MMTLDFTIADEALKKAFAVYKASRSSVMLFAPMVVLLRVAWGYFQSHGPIEFLEILKDLVICVALLFFFQQYVEFLLQIPYFVSKSFGGVSSEVNVDSQDGGYLFQELARITNYVSIFTYWIAKLTYFAAMLVMIGLAAWAIFAFIMFGIYGGLFSYLAVMMLVAMVPAFWIGVNFALTILFDAESPVRNNILITLGNCGKAVIAYKAFMMALHEPFLKPLTSAFKHSIGSGSKAVMAAKTGGLSVASNGSAGITALGGGHLVQGASTRMASLKDNAQKTVAKTIPTAEALLKGAGKSGTSFLSKNMPKVSSVTAQGKEFFKSKMNPYTGKSIPGSSPMTRLFKSQSSFTASSRSQPESLSLHRPDSFSVASGSALNAGVSLPSESLSEEKKKVSTKTDPSRRISQGADKGLKTANPQSKTTEKYSSKKVPAFSQTSDAGSTRRNKPSNLKLR